MSLDLEKEDVIIFPLDSMTSYFNHFQVVEQGDRNLLYMLTQFNNRFVVYDIETQELVKSFEFENDQRNPISIGEIPPSGFSYVNPDTIILYDFYKQQIYIGNENGEKDLLINLMRKFPSERDNWGSAYQSAEPILINDSILSITASVFTGNEPFHKDQKSDLYINLNSKEVWKENVFPEEYLSGNYYSNTRLRPTRAQDKQRGLMYYNYLNADSIYILDIKSGDRTAFYASHIDKLPSIETSSIDEFRTFADGFDSQRIYNNSQGTFVSVFYNPFKNQIIRLGYPGIVDFNNQDFKDGFYKDEKTLSFYDAGSYEFLGNVSIEGLGYDFMFFDENSFYVAQIENNKSEDELVFTKFKYPDF